MHADQALERLILVTGMQFDALQLRVPPRSRERFASITAHGGVL